MEYQITVGQHRKFLFRIESHGLTTSDAFVKVITVLDKQFPEKDGFYFHIEGNWIESVHVDIEELREAIKSKRGKGFMLKLRNKKRRAWMLAYTVYDLLKKGNRM
jgi:hypothetical protein